MFVAGVSQHCDESPSDCSLNRIEKSQLLGSVVYDVSTLKTVTHVMDMDGFIIDKKFHPKEIAIVDMQYRATRFDVRLPIEEEELTEKQRQYVKHVAENVHGMNFDNSVKVSRFMLYPNYVVRAIQNFFETEAKLRNQRVVVAFKGGQFERTLLKSINVSFIDLENYGCPSFDYLVDKFPHIYTSSSLANLFYDRDWIMFCDLHNVQTMKPVHCAIVECRAFVTWLNIALNKWIVIPIANYNPKTMKPVQCLTYTIDQEKPEYTTVTCKL